MTTEIKIAHCPKCNQKIETDEGLAHRGIKCPTCGTGFIPERIETELHQPFESQVKLYAEQLSSLSVGFILIGFILIIVSAFVAKSEGSAWGTFYTGVSFFGFGIWICFLAQLFHIRASLEK